MGTHTVPRLSGWLETAAAKVRLGTPAPAEDWSLWREACAGHERSAQRLVRELTPQAFGLAMQLLRRAEDAEDAVQDAFLRLWRSDPSDTRGARLATYFNTIVINRCRTRLVATREEATEPEALADLHDALQEAQSSGIGGHADSGDAVSGVDHGALTLALAGLPVRQRMALVMWAYADAGVPEIARTLDIDANAAHQLLHRAKLALRSRLEGARP
jgi:RNA polymerase sigma-70 factor (ECF subfamily)